MNEAISSRQIGASGANALKPVRIGIIGAGTRGKFFAHSLRSSVYANVVALCDASTPVADAARLELGFPVFASPAEMLKEGLDAVIIATPDFAHLEPALAAAEGGCHLMIEKPLATSVSDGRKIVEAVRAAGVSSFVAFENRWNPAFSTLRDRVAAGDLGSVVSQTAVLSTAKYVATRHLSWAAKSSPSWFLIPHILDLALWLADSRPVRLTAYGTRGRLAAAGVDTWDDVQALVELANGSLVNLHSSWVVPDNASNAVDFRFHFAGENGTAEINQTQQTLTISAARVIHPRTLALQQYGEPRGFPVWMVTDWAKGLATGKPIGPGVEHGLLVTEALEAIDRSLATRQSVEL